LYSRTEEELGTREELLGVVPELLLELNATGDELLGISLELLNSSGGKGGGGISRSDVQERSSVA